MTAKDLPGNKLTNIYSIIKFDSYGMDTGQCFLEFDYTLVIVLPYGPDEEFFDTEVPDEAIGLFEDLSDDIVYVVNKERKSVREIAEEYQRKNNTFFRKLLKKVFGFQPGIKRYRPYKIEYRENKMQYLKDRTVTDFLWYAEGDQKGIIQLDNGYLFTEIISAPNGTGQAGIRLFETIGDVPDVELMRSLNS